MGEINKPSKRTFWKVSNESITHEGFTDADQQTTTGLPTMVSDTNADNVYSPLPSQIGTVLTENEIYSYNGAAVVVRQTHNRTEFEPIQTPNLFAIFRANTDGLDWVANEDVIIGDERNYEGNTYKCLQSHFTLETWQPPNVPALWLLVVVQTSQWQEGVLYSVSDEVEYLGITYICLQSHTSISTWIPPNVPALWQLK